MPASISADDIVGIRIAGVKDHVAVPADNPKWLFFLHKACTDL